MFRLLLGFCISGRGRAQQTTFLLAKRVLETRFDNTKGVRHSHSETKSSGIGWFYTALLVSYPTGTACPGGAALAITAHRSVLRAHVVLIR